MADDLLDLFGEEQIAGKTLGSDTRRGKFTLPQVSRNGPHIARQHICELCTSALECVEMWPDIRDAFVSFIAGDLQPIFDLCGERFNAGVEFAV